MRPVNKGAAPSHYTAYKDARNDLATKIGRYCSYCEMKVWNSIEVEHVVPVHNGGDPLCWSNFLLSCRYCNGIKQNKNPSRDGYVWPDEDNTLRAFNYQEGQPLSPASNLSTDQNIRALATIELLGLDREPGSTCEPTEADTRWLSRYEAWRHAKSSLNNWNQCQTDEMKRQILLTATGTGHFSIWMEVFSNHPQIRIGLINAFEGTDLASFNNGTPIQRPGGII